MIVRKLLLGEIAHLFKDTDGLALLGARQTGKTTLAKEYAKTVKTDSWFLDLEDPNDLAKLENPKLFLEDLKGLIVLDEIQNRPDLFPVLRVLLDQKKKQRKFLILGSASPDLIRQGSETLAGRITFININPFSIQESGETQRLWLRGGFPRSFLAKSDDSSLTWRRAFIETFLERDIARLGSRIPVNTLRRFWLMLVHYHGGLFKASEIGQSLGFSDKTMRHYLDILTGTFMIRELKPWHENIGKRQVKLPKIFFRDSGILHALIDLENFRQLKLHPKMGLSWEGFALEETIKYLRLSPSEAFFWSTHNETDLDLFCFKKGKRIGVEIKFTDAPKVTRSMKIAFADLKLDAMFVIYPGKDAFVLGKKITAIPVSDLARMNI